MIVHRILELIGGWLVGFAMTVVVCLAVTAFLGLNLFKFDRDSFLAALRRISTTMGRGWGWILAAIALLLQVYGLSELHTGLMDRLSQQGQARYIATQDPGGSPTTQRAPRVSFLETTTRSQRIILP